MLKHDSIYYEHFYKQLQPWVHYIPFKADLSDLLEKIQWARDHDEEVHHPHSHTNIKSSQCFGVQTLLSVVNIFGLLIFFLINCKISIFFYLIGEENCPGRSAVCTNTSNGRQYILLLLQTLPGNRFFLSYVQCSGVSVVAMTTPRAERSLFC